MTGVTSISIIGAGTMGSGIAYVASAAGFDVTLHDSDAGLRASTIARIGASYEAAIARGKCTLEIKREALSRVRVAGTVGETVRNADLVIEAVPELLEMKQAVFLEVERHAPSHAVLATNTSSLSVSGIATPLTDPGRVIGMHFFNPVHAMRLVEIVRGRFTDEHTVAVAIDVAERLGKTSILVRDTPGFATSRLGVVLGLEAIRMLEQGVASAEDIDRAMSLGYNHPMGPLRLTDLVGLDVRLAVAEHLFRTLGGDTYRPPELLRRLVAEGHLGRKTGQGFFRWETDR